MLWLPDPCYLLDDLEYRLVLSLFVDCSSPYTTGKVCWSTSAEPYETSAHSFLFSRASLPSIEAVISTTSPMGLVKAATISFLIRDFDFVSSFVLSSLFMFIELPTFIEPAVWLDGAQPLGCWWWPPATGPSCWPSALSFPFRFTWGSRPVIEMFAFGADGRGYRASTPFELISLVLNFAPEAALRCQALPHGWVGRKRVADWILRGWRNRKGWRGKQQEGRPIYSPFPRFIPFSPLYPLVP